MIWHLFFRTDQKYLKRSVLTNFCSENESMCFRKFLSLFTSFKITHFPFTNFWTLVGIDWNLEFGFRVRHLSIWILHVLFIEVARFIAKCSSMRFCFLLDSNLQLTNFLFLLFVLLPTRSIGKKFQSFYCFTRLYRNFWATFYYYVNHRHNKLIISHENGTF